MSTQLSETELFKELRTRNSIVGFRILVRQLTVRLRVEDDSFHATIDLKIYLSDASMTRPYEYVASHHVKTPTQGDIYRPGATEAATELATINLAIANTLRFIESAIAEGEKPDESWLVPNERF